MRVIDSKIDLAASFEKLKEQLERTNNYQLYYAEKYSILKNAIQSHLVDCTLGAGPNIPAADPNDLKTVNI